MILGAVFFVAFLAGCAGARWEIENPYAEVDWERHRQHKTNLHTHTTLSDGKARPEAVIDRYAELGYSILSLTDHDTMGPRAEGEKREPHLTTWPWRAFGREPEAVGMVAIEGNEISKRHHIGSYFNAYGDANLESEEAALEEIARQGGLAVLFHPGRYRKPAAWYVDLYHAYPHLVGLEIYNQGDRYPRDRAKWDSILVAVAAERPVWGFSNDDMHDLAADFGRNWNVMLLPELSAEAVRRAMEMGSFFFCYVPHGPAGAAPPVIESVTVDRRRGVIALRATGHARIEWISAGAIVHRGDSIDLSRRSDVVGYVRAVVYATDGESLVGTQPFRVRPRAEH